MSVVAINDSGRHLHGSGGNCNDKCELALASGATVAVAIVAMAAAATVAVAIVAMAAAATAAAGKNSWSVITVEGQAALHFFFQALAATWS